MTKPTAIHKRTGTDEVFACGRDLYDDIESTGTWRYVTCGGCLAVQRAQKNPNRKVLKVHKVYKGFVSLTLCNITATRIGKDWRQVTCKACRKLGGKAPLKS